MEPDQGSSSSGSKAEEAKESKVAWGNHASELALAAAVAVVAVAAYSERKVRAFDAGWSSSSDLISMQQVLEQAAPCWLCGCWIRTRIPTQWLSKQPEFECIRSGGQAQIRLQRHLSSLPASTICARQSTLNLMRSFYDICRLQAISDAARRRSRALRAAILDLGRMGFSFSGGYVPAQH
eukprot:scaffold274850_cov19-Tisochrysis_lutea.AAC.1